MFTADFILGAAFGMFLTVALYVLTDAILGRWD